MSDLEAVADSLTNAERAQTEAWVDVLESSRAVDRVRESFGQCRFAMGETELVEFFDEIRAEVGIFIDSVHRWKTARDLVAEYGREFDLRVMS